jgi:hypothetical protein
MGEQEGMSEDPKSNNKGDAAKSMFETHHQHEPNKTGALGPKPGLANVTIITAWDRV